MVGLRRRVAPPDPCRARPLFAGPPSAFLCDAPPCDAVPVRAAFLAPRFTPPTCHGAMVELRRDGEPPRTLALPNRAELCSTHRCLALPDPDEPRPAMWLALRFSSRACHRATAGLCPTTPCYTLPNQTKRRRVTSIIPHIGAPVGPDHAITQRSRNHPSVPLIRPQNVAPPAERP
jgi:hypothetical protein